MASWRFFREVLRDLIRRRRMSRKNLASEAGVSVGLVDRALKGEPIREENARAIAGALGVRLEELAKPTSVQTCDRSLYPLVGLLPEPPRELGDEEPFQHFDMFSGTEANMPLGYLWASPTGGRISAKLVKCDDVWGIRVEFENEPNGSPANLEIHPTDMIARKRKANQRHLVFEIRVFSRICG